MAGGPVPALAMRQGLSSRQGVGVSVWMLKNAANNFTPAKELRAAFLSQFSRPPLRIFFRSPTLERGRWEQHGTRADSSNPTSKATVSHSNRRLCWEAFLRFINCLGVPFKIWCAVQQPCEIVETGIVCVYRPFIAFGQENLMDSPKVTQLDSGGTGTTRSILQYLVSYFRPF